MDKLKFLRMIVTVLAVLLGVELVVLVMMIKPATPALWLTIGVIALVGIYLVRVSLGLIKELKDKP